MNALTSISFNYQLPVYGDDMRRNKRETTPHMEMLPVPHSGRQAEAQVTYPTYRQSRSIGLTTRGHFVDTYA